VWSAGAADKPVVVFLHGFVAGATINWEHQISTFTKDFNVYVPDLVTSEVLASTQMSSFCSARSPLGDTGF
jgi:hypothetical protein